MTTTAQTSDGDARVTSNLLVVGGVLAVLGNALHPFLPADATTAAFLREATTNPLWVPLHLAIAVSIGALAAGMVLVLRRLRATPAATLATSTAVLAVMGGGLFIFQIGVLDGYVLPQLGAADQTPELLAAATAITTLDTGLLSLIVLLYFGVTFAAFGMALEQADTFARWVRWTATGGGTLGIVVGTLMLLDVAGAVTLVAFRVVALASTVVVLGIGIALRRESAPTPDPAPAPA